MVRKQFLAHNMVKVYINFGQNIKDIGGIKTWYNWYCWGCFGWLYTHHIILMI